MTVRVQKEEIRERGGHSCACPLGCRLRAHLAYLVVGLAVLLCPGPVAGATDYFVAPYGDDADPGTAAAPFATIEQGLTAVENGDRLLISGGVYRLMEESEEAHNLYRPDATASSLVTVEPVEGERVVILGSLSTEGLVWEPVSGGLFRLSASFLVRDPKGMFLRGQDVEDATRVEHVMVTRSGTRSHADVADLVDPGTWTKADDAGLGCGNDNAGCFIYLYPSIGEDPNLAVYELSQRKLMHAQGTSYLQIRGLRIYYTQNDAFTLEGGSFQLVEGNVLGHNSNGNDNAYSVFISYGGGAVVRGNIVFDSKYWGGFSNSKGITFMDNDPALPALVEENEVFDIIGQGITSKSGVSGLVVRRNLIHDVGVCVESPGPRCHWTTPDCVEGDPEFYPGGSWQIYENAMVRCGTGVLMRTTSEANGSSTNNRIFNNVFFLSETAGVDVRLANTGTVIANNIFVQNARGVYLNHGGSGESATVEEFLPVFSSHHNLFFENDADYLMRPDWTGPGGSGTSFTMEEMQSIYAVESASIAGDPALVDPLGDDFHLQDGSPAQGTGDGDFYQAESVDMGRYPFGEQTGPEPDVPDAGVTSNPDGGGDASSSSSGCACRAGAGQSLPAVPALLLALFLLGLRLRAH